MILNEGTYCIEIYNESLLSKEVSEIIFEAIPDETLEGIRIGISEGIP